MPTNEFLIHKAIELAKAGQKEGARAILLALYPKETDNVRFWAASALAARTDQEAIDSLEQIVKLQPDNLWARSQLQQLRQGRQGQVRAARGRRFWGQVIALHAASYAGLLAAILVTAALVLLGPTTFPVVAETTPLPSTSMPSAPTPDAIADGDSTSFGVQPPDEPTETPPPTSTSDAVLPAATMQASATLTPSAVPSETPPPTDSLTPRTAATAAPTRTSAPTATSVPTEAPLPTIPPDLDVATNVPEPAGEPCDCYTTDLSCDDFRTRDDAQACYDYCLELTGTDIHGLDRNLNQLACDAP